MRRFVGFLLLVILGLGLMMGTTLFLELEFVQRFVIRQLLIYLLILFEFFVFGRIFMIMYKVKGAD
ncbi:hypothetical protein NJB85_02075 [Myroides odoratimimus]|uniref:hypothetical protein n=1 Tax=Myroides odoratimimus TaxID=76832 RepID=UPI002096C48A|nr:hypothetical protein [Myroides odoratimimus]MCO7721964.1 hypothetical protein [Myroides odoratimimus]